MKQVTHNGNIPDWKNDKYFFVKGDVYNYKIENDNYLVYFHSGQTSWLNIPCRFSKKQFNLYFTSINELRKQKLEKICSLKD